MEHAKGGELFNYIISKRKLNEQEASYFFYQIINGMEYLHKNNIVHRDLKPENLLLTEEKIIKIIDFGLSNEFLHGNLLKTPCGSPCYAAPEMVLGKKYSGIKIDIWSTGIILYAMTCGYLPFEDKKNELLFKKIIECDYEFPSFLSHNVKDMIKKILVTNPRDRATIEDIRKHQFYNQGKIIFYKEQKYILENLFSNIEIDRIINQKIIAELNKKLEENFTLDDVENMRKSKKDKNANKVRNKFLNNSDIILDDEEEFDILNDSEYKNHIINSKINEENKKDVNNENNEYSRNLNKNLKQENFLKKEKRNAKFYVSYDILYNNILKDKDFIKNVLSKLPKELSENNVIDRESRRSRSITSNQGSFQHPKINININCMKKIENVNFNIVPVVSISSVPFTSRTQKNKIDIVNFRSSEKIGTNNNSINNTNNSINLNKKQKIDKSKNSNSSYGANILNSANQNNLNINFINSNSNCNSVNTLNNIVCIDSNNVINNVNSDNSKNINSNKNYNNYDNVNSSKNKLIKPKTATPKLNYKNGEAYNIADAKSMYTQFKDCKVNLLNNTNKQITSMKKKNYIDKTNQYLKNNNQDIYKKHKNHSMNQENRSDRTNYTKTSKFSFIHLVNSKNLNLSINKKKRDLSIRLGTPRKNELSNTLLNNIFKKTNLNNTNIYSNINNNTINNGSNYKNANSKNHLEKVNLDNNNLNSINYPINSLNNNININNDTLNAILNSNNIIKNISNIPTNNSLHINVHNIADNYKSNNINNKIYFFNSINKVGKSPQKKYEYSIANENKKIKSFKDLSINSDKKVFSSERKVITSCDRIFSEDSSNNYNNSNFNYNSINGNYMKLFEKKNFKTNSINIYRNNKETIYLNRIIQNNNNYSKNKTIQPEKHDLIFKPESSCDENKLKRLRRIAKDSLGSSSFAFDLSCLQRLESPLKKNSTNNCVSTTTSKNNFKITLRDNQASKIGNTIAKDSAESSSRVVQGRYLSGVYSKSRPQSRQNNRTYSQQNPVNSSTINSKNFYNKATNFHKDFENFFKKVTESLKNNNGNNAKDAVGNYINASNNINNANEKNDADSIDVNSKSKNPNIKSSEKYLKYDLKYDKEKLLNNYVTLDLFNLKKNSKNVSKKVETQRPNIAKNSENVFKATINKEKKIINENINSNYLTNLSNYPKLSYKSNSISKNKIALSSKQSSKK